MKIKLKIIIIIIMCITGLLVSAIFCYKHRLKKVNIKSNKIDIVEKQNVEETTNSNESTNEKNESNSKSDEKQKGKEIKNESTISNSSKKNNANKKQDVTKESTKQNVVSKNEISSNTVPNTIQEVNQDEKLWEEFKKDPIVLMVLESDSIDWENKSEQDKEANKWINLGYRVEMPYQCIYLNGQNRCVYGLIVYLPKGVCNETPNEIKIDWRKKNYIGIISYAKSIGYKCEGYHD